MTIEQELDELPQSYAVALRLRASGADDALIAIALGIDVESVGPLLAVARRKLARTREDDPGPDSPA
jgi:DNA-directed RNA polymerase specialized sigma24 family protein